MLLPAVVAACGGTSRHGVPLSDWLSPAQGKEVTVRLVAGYNDAYNGFNFNGYGKGQVLVSVPRGWRVTVRCKNGGSGRPHSCAVVRGAGPTRPAFAGAETPGLAPGKSASFAFTPVAGGTYRLASVLDHDEQAGEWDVLEVTESGAPTVRLLRASP